jgi:hypothetical protein
MQVHVGSYMLTTRMQRQYLYCDSFWLLQTTMAMVGTHACSCHCHDACKLRMAGNTSSWPCQYHCSCCVSGRSDGMAQAPAAPPLACPGRHMETQSWPTHRQGGDSFPALLT